MRMNCTPVFRNFYVLHQNRLYAAPTSAIKYTNHNTVMLKLGTLANGTLYSKIFVHPFFREYPVYDVTKGVVVTGCQVVVHSVASLGNVPLGVSSRDTTT